MDTSGPVLGLRIKTPTHADCPGSLILKMPQAFPSDAATRNLLLYFARIGWVKFVHPTHLLTILTKHACYHNSLWGSRCDSNHASNISLKLVHFHGDFGNSVRHMTQVLLRHTSLLTSDNPRNSSYFGHISYKIFTFGLIPTKTNLYRLATQNILKTNQSIQMF